MALLPPMDCDGLADVWEQDPEIRTRMRDHGDLIKFPPGSKWAEPNRPNSVLNRAVLIPMLVRLRETESGKLPHLNPLQSEIGALYGRFNLPVDKGGPYRNAQELKRLLGLIKRKANRRELTKDS